MSHRYPVFIWGATGPALVVEDILNQNDQYEIVGYIDNLNPNRKGEPFGCATVLGGEEVFDALAPRGVTRAIIAFANGKAKLQAAARLRSKGFSLITAIHPSASVARTARIGAGTIVRAQAVVGPNAGVGENCIIGYGAIVSHDCVVADGCHLSSGVNLGGNCRSRVRVLDRNRRHAPSIHELLGRTRFWALDTVATRDIPGSVVAFGVPAKVVRAASTSAGAVD